MTHAELRELPARKGSPLALELVDLLVASKFVEGALASENIPGTATGTLPIGNCSKLPSLSTRMLQAHSSPVESPLYSTPPL